MTRAILHTPSGHEEFVIDLPPTFAADNLEYREKTYRYVGFQDGVAHYAEVKGAE